MSEDFAILVPEEVIAALSDGRIQGKVGVCAVRDGVSETYITWPGSVNGIVGDLPVAPATAGHPAALLEYEVEIEALQFVSDAVDDEISHKGRGIPPFFIAAEPVLVAGLNIMFNEQGIDLQMSPRLARRLRWKASDTVCFAMSIDGGTAVIYRDDNGSELMPSSSEAGHLEVGSYIPKPGSIPEDFVSSWLTPSYWISDSRIYLDMSGVRNDRPANVETSVAADQEAFVPAASPFSEIMAGMGVGAFATALAVVLWRLLTG